MDTFKRQWLKEIPNQGKEGSCTAFAMCNIINWFKEPKFKEQWLEREAINWHDYFSLVNKTYPEDLQGVLAPIQALVYAKNNGYISFYEFIDFSKNWDTALLIKGLLNQGFLLLCVINKCDRTKTAQTKVCEKITETGKHLPHSVVLVDYDAENQLFKFVNSWGNEWGDAGYFYMKFEDVQYFISQMYAVFDSDDTANFERMLYKTKILTATSTIGEQRKFATPDEQVAMNLANSVLRKVVLGQNHQYNLNKKQLINLINKYF